MSLANFVKAFKPQTSSIDVLPPNDVMMPCENAISIAQKAKPLKAKPRAPQHAFIYKRYAPKHTPQKKHECQCGHKVSKP
ncbi:hypothetical protein, partial [Vibrio vulnificus]